MNKKIIGILVATLLISSAISGLGHFETDNNIKSSSDVDDSYLNLPFIQKNILDFTADKTYNSSFDKTMSSESASNTI